MDQIAVQAARNLPKTPSLQSSLGRGVFPQDLVQTFFHSAMEAVGAAGVAPVAPVGGGDLAMASSILLVPIALDAQEPLVAKMNHGLSFVWNTLQVPMELQARLAQMGFWDLEVWSNAEDSKEAMRKFVMNEVGIKKEGNDMFRSLVGRLLSSWQSGEIQGTQRKQEEAAQLVGDQFRRMPAKYHLELLKCYNNAHRRLDEY